MLFMILCLFILILNSLLSIYIYTYVAYIFFVIYILVLLFKNLNLSISNQINVWMQTKSIIGVLLFQIILFIDISKRYYNLLIRFNKFLLKWKPLFKKSSYFGLYRSMRNQYLNK